MQFTKRDLTTTELLILNSEMNKQEKSLALSYLMLLAGHLGVHRFYLKRTVSGIIQLVLFLLTFILYFGFGIAAGIESELSPHTYNSLLLMVPFVVTFIGLSVWVIVDACLLPGMVRRWNERLEQSLVAQLISSRTGTDNRM